MVMHVDWSLNNHKFLRIVYFTFDGGSRSYLRHLVGCVRPRSHAVGPDKSRLSHTWYKNAINIDGANGPVSDVKLIRTDTTLDLSQKAEKV